MIAFKQFEKRPVFGAGGRLFGDLDDLLIDDKTWRIVSLVVRLESDAVEALGLEKPFWRRARLSLPADIAHEENGVLVLELTLDEFSELLDGDAIEADVM